MREDRLTRAYGQPDESDKESPNSIVPKALETQYVMVDGVECLYITPQNVDFDIEKPKVKKSKHGPQIPERIINQLPVRQKGRYKLN